MTNPQSASIVDRLKAPFPPDRISWRIGSTTGDKKRGMALAYIDARDVMDRLDSVCGPAGWQDDYPHAAAKTICRIGIKFDGEWIWKSDGAGDTDVEAEKGALSDAFKRAAVRWGIGRYLYDVASPWVEIEPAGKSFKIKETEFARLAKILGANVPVSQSSAPNEADAEFLPEAQAVKAAQELIAGVKACANPENLRAYINSAEFKTAHNQLPDAHYEEVKTSVKSRFPKKEKVA